MTIRHTKKPFSDHIKETTHTAIIRIQIKEIAKKLDAGEEGKCRKGEVVDLAVEYYVKAHNIK